MAGRRRHLREREAVSCKRSDPFGGVASPAAPVLLRSTRAVAALALVSLGHAGCAPTYRGPPSTHFDGRRFHNETPTTATGVSRVLGWMLTRTATPWPREVSPTPTTVPARRVSGDEVRVTFVNHATMLVQMGGVNVLTDPVWSDFIGPSELLSQRRHHPPGVRFEDLPPIDLVLLSHNHYDHFDAPTLARLVVRDHPLIAAGLGNRELLDSLGLRPSTELDWWECRPLRGARVCAVPAQHGSRRGLFDGDATLWAGYWIETAAGAVYFAGDTGFGPHFAEIRRRLGAPCMALLPIGAYLPRWFMSPNHMGPEEAVRAHDLLGARTSVAMHFATFNLADEGMYQPAGALGLALAQGSHRPFLAPSFGEAVSLSGCRNAEPR